MPPAPLSFSHNSHRLSNKSYRDTESSLLLTSPLWAQPDDPAQYLDLATAEPITDCLLKSPSTSSISSGVSSDSDSYTSQSQYGQQVDALSDLPTSSRLRPSYAMPQSRESNSHFRVSLTKPLKGRRSLQSILQPSFSPLASLGFNVPSPTQSTSPARRRAYTHSVVSSAESHPSTEGRMSPPFLLDDDPFANLSSPTFASYPQVPDIPEETPYRKAPPPSPLNPNSSSTSSTSYLPSASVASRHHSSRSFSQSSLARPAYRRPAFTPRPSLPSLSTLSKLDMRVPVRVRKGKVGATLPPEPWEKGPSLASAVPEHVIEASGFSAAQPVEELPAEEEPECCESGDPSQAALESDDDSSELLNSELTAEDLGNDDDHVFYMDLSGSDYVGSSEESSASSSPSASPAMSTSTLEEQVEPTSNSLDEFIVDYTTDDILAVPACESEAHLNELIPSAPPQSLFVDTSHVQSFTTFTDLNYVASSPEEYNCDADQLDLAKPVLGEDSTSLPPLSLNYEEDFIFSPVPPPASNARHNRNLSILSYESSASVSPGSLVHSEDGVYSRSYQSSESSLGEEWSSTENAGVFVDDGDEEVSFAPRSSVNTYSIWGDDLLQIDEEQDLHSQIGWKLLSEKDMGFEPGSSAGTVRPSSFQRRALDEHARPSSSGSSKVLNSLRNSDVFTRVRSHGGSSRPGTSGGGNGSYNWQNNYGSNAGYGHSGDYRPPDGGAGNRSRGHGGGNGDDNGDDKRRRPSNLPTSSSTSSSDAESTSQSEDDYGAPEPTPARESQVAQQSQLRNGRKGVFRPPSNLTADAEGDRGRAAIRTSLEEDRDDDVPLAQRIPGALTAQKSIRRQVRREQSQRRRDPTESRHLSPQETAPPVPQFATVTRGRTLVDRSAPVTAGFLYKTEGLSSSQEAALHSQQTSGVRSGVRRPRAKTLGGSGPAPGDLTKRLLQLQVQDNQSHSQQASPISTATTPLSAKSIDRWKSVSRRRAVSPPVQPEASRSSVDQNHGNGSNGRSPIDAPTRDETKVLRPKRSFHVSRPPSPNSSVPNIAVPAIPQHFDLGRSATTASRAKSSGNDAQVGLGRAKSIKSARPSLDTQNRGSGATIVPPLPLTTPSRSSNQNQTRVQTRIFVGDLKKFSVVETLTTTTAGEVLEMVEKRGELVDDARSGGWMLWEVSQDFGMERPIRSYEVLSEISASWDIDKSVNLFMAKKTSLASLFSAVPSSVPLYGGFVELESKKGKWSKRWLELRDHSLFLSKKEGKAEELLCTLLSFEVFFVTRIHKAPKPFVFALKSTDSIKLFENTADFLHVFCCSEESGKQWMEYILQARSYVLYQEKQARKDSDVANRSFSGRPSTNTKAHYTHSLPQSTTHSNNPFEPGSLLAKRSAA